jgi:hypothetical protein
MPPKFYSKAKSKLIVYKGNYSNDHAGEKNKRDNRISVTFLLVGINRIGV